MLERGGRKRPRFVVREVRNMSEIGVGEAVVGDQSGAPEGAKRKRRSLPRPRLELGLLLIDQLAAHLGLGLKTMKRLASENYLPCIRLGNRWYYDPVQVADRLRRQADKDRDGEYRFD
jgi:hypothetical protein